MRFVCRYHLQDFDGDMINEATSKQHTLPSSFIQSYSEYINARKWQERAQRQVHTQVLPRSHRVSRHFSLAFAGACSCVVTSQEEQTYVKRTKRKYQKRREREQHRLHVLETSSVLTHHHVARPASPAVAATTPALASVHHLPQYSSSSSRVDVLNDGYSTDEPLSPAQQVRMTCKVELVGVSRSDCVIIVQQVSSSDHEAEPTDTDPDGPYAFRRKEGCSYHAVRSHSLSFAHLRLTSLYEKLVPSACSRSQPAVAIGHGSGRKKAEVATHVSGTHSALFRSLTGSALVTHGGESGVVVGE